MDEKDIVVVTDEQVRGLLAGREPQVVDAVLGAYRSHGRSARRPGLRLGWQGGGATRCGGD